MPLNKLENFIKNTEGRILYVNPNDLDATDSISNQGNSLAQPFKTIQRALLESARFSYVEGNNNDLIEKTTILLFPGDHVVDNRPGFGIKVVGNTATAVAPDGSGSNGVESNATETLSLNLTSVFDLTQEDNILYKFNSIHGGVIVPRGTSLVGLDLRKTKVKPKYVPNPMDSGVSSSAIFRITGTCYFWQFSIFDGDESGVVFTDSSDFSEANRSKPTFSHHKLTCFEYADGVNVDDRFNLTDLAIYYSKLSNAFNRTARPIDQDDRFPTSTTGIAPQRPEFEIVGAFASDPITIANIKSGDGITPTSIITVTTSTDHGLTTGTPIKIKGVADLRYNLSTKVQNVTGDRVFTYLLPFVPDDLAAAPSATAATATIETDTVSGASPYIFNISLRSVYGMNGMHADGAKATGFRSMVVAQFTAISLQKDDRAFVKYDKETRQYRGITPPASPSTGSELATLSSATDATEVYHLDSDAVYRRGFETTHIKLSNDAIMQIVSVFAIGFNQHFFADTGADASITNSNSNFGQFAIASDSFKKDAFAKDDAAYVSHILAPKEITSTQTDVDWQRFDTTKTINTGISSHLYLFGFDTLDNAPPTVIQGYRVGAATSDRVFVDFTNTNAGSLGYGISEATIRMNDQLVSVGSTGNTSSIKHSKVNSGPTNNTFVVGEHKFITGEKVRILSDSGDLPENLEDNTIYFAIVIAGSPSNQIQLASSKTNADLGVPLIVHGGTKLRIESRVSDKAAGDVGSPLQFDTNNSNWYLHANRDNEIYQTIVNVGSAGTGLGLNTPVSFIQRTPDERSLDEKIFKLRVVVPKESKNAKNPEEGFIIQESSSTGIRSDVSVVLQNINNDDFDYKRNYRFISTCSESSDTVTMVSVAPHDLKVGERIFVRNCKDDDANGTSTGVFDKGYNGSFIVESIVDDKTFTYNAQDTEGVVHSIGNFTSDTTSDAARTTTLPRFERNDSKSNFYIYRNETISPYIKDTQDGIYHLFVLNADNTVSEEFTNFKFSQNVEDLYPQLDRDNNNSNPPAAVSFAKRAPLGDVSTDDLRKSITRETSDKILQDIGYGKIITGVTTSFSSGNVGVATITFDRPHGYGAVKHAASISAAGANLTNGTFHGIKLFNQDGSTWDGARCSVVISGGQVGVVTITEGGSGYVAETLVIDRQFIGGSSGTTAATITITNANGSSGISTNIGDAIQVTGIGTASDGLYRIESIPSTTQVSVALTATSPRPIVGQFAVNVAPPIEISSETFDTVTGITTFTTTLGHGLISGQKFKVTDANNQNLGSYLIKTKISATQFTSVTRVDLGTPQFIIADGVASASPLSDKENENVGSRGLSFYDGDYFFLGADSNAGNLDEIVVNLPNSGANAGIRERFPIGSYLQAGDEIMRVKSTVITGTNTIKVIRSVLGTPQQAHLSGDPVRKIVPKAIEFRRPSIIRASGHTFEYLGFGPGNYSTALPQVQVRTLSEREEFLVQSQERSCGTVVYTGMNNRGDFFIGNKRVSSATGQERTFDAPLATVTGEDPSRLSVIFDEVIIKERLVVEGGKSNTILSQFDGPVTFNKLVKINEDLTVNGIMKLNNTFEITDTTDSHSKDTGALVLEGGVGIEKNLNVGGNFNVSLGSTFQDLRVVGITTLAGLVFFDNGILVNNIGIASNTSGQNVINGIAGGDLVLTADSNTVQVDANLSVTNSITATQLNVDQTRLNGNVLETTSGDNDLILQAHNVGIVSCNDRLQVNSFTFDGDSENYDSVVTTLDPANPPAAHDKLISARAVGLTIGAIDTTLAIAGDTGTDNVSVGVDTLTFAGTGNEVNTTVTNNQVQIGLPNNVTIGNNLTVTNDLTVNGDASADRLDVNNIRLDGSTITITSNAAASEDLILNTTDTTGEVRIGAGNGNNEPRDLRVYGDLIVEGNNSDFLNRLQVDNIILENNTITTSNNNGNLVLNADGSGNVEINANALNVNNNFDVDGSTTLADTTISGNLALSGGHASFDDIRINGSTISRLNSSNGSITMLPQGSGDVIIGDGTDNALRCKGDVIAFHGSDRTLKENITPIPNALDKVLSLSGNTYTWIKGHKYEGENDTGVIAQEVDALGLPGLAITREDGKMAVRYEKLIPVLIEAIKELKSEIEELKK